MDDGGNWCYNSLFMCVFLCVFLSVHAQSRINHYYDTYYNPTNQGLVSLSSKLQRHSDSSTTTTTKNDTKRKHKKLPACLRLLLHYSTARRKIPLPQNSVFLCCNRSVQFVPIHLSNSVPVCSFNVPTSNLYPRFPSTTIAYSNST